MNSRRSFLKNAAGILIAAPLVVKASNLMKIAMVEEDEGGILVPEEIARMVDDSFAQFVPGMSMGVSYNGQRFHVQIDDRIAYGIRPLDRGVIHEQTFIS